MKMNKEQYRKKLKIMQKYFLDRVQRGGFFEYLRTSTMLDIDKVKNYKKYLGSLDRRYIKMIVATATHEN